MTSSPVPAGPSAGSKRSESARRVALLILSLADHPKPLSLADLSRTLQLPKSTLLSFLRSLEDYGFVIRDEHGRYSLGMRLFSAASAATRGLGLGREAHDRLEALSRTVRLTANLAVLSGPTVTYVDKVQDYSSPVQLVTFVGGSMPAHATALGKVLVAELPTDLREPWIANHEYVLLTNKTVPNARTMEDSIAQYRRDGFAVDDEESHLGVMCIAAPIRDRWGRVEVALSVTALKAGPLQVNREWIVQELLDTAKMLSSDVSDGVKLD